MIISVGKSSVRRKAGAISCDGGEEGDSRSGVQHRAGVLRSISFRSFAGELVAGAAGLFGAHTYERIDQPRGKFFHTNWTGKGGTTSSSSYNV